MALPTTSPRHSRTDSASTVTTFEDVKERSSVLTVDEGVSSSSDIVKVIPPVHEKRSSVRASMLSEKSINKADIIEDKNDENTEEEGKEIQKLERGGQDREEDNKEEEEEQGRVLTPVPVEEEQSVAIPRSVDYTTVDPVVTATPPDHHIVTTDSMVTVRLSGTEDLKDLSSPTPTLKLVPDDDDTEPPTSPSTSMISDEEIDSAITEEPLNRDSVSSVESNTEKQGVDWEGLERTEDEHSKDDSGEDQTAFLLARLEKENTRLEADPKVVHITSEKERPPSIRDLKKIIKNADPEKLRYSQLPVPMITDLDFYAALVADYQRCASKLPYLVSKKIRAGIPPPLRGVVWISMSGARDSNLEGLYEQLLGETSPYEHMIFKDLGRTGLEMFRQEGGEGQRMLGRVLRAFSIYDTQIGYCQGLGFLVGPLLMHMGEKEAFCVLVRLMEHYDLRSSFLPNMYGLQLRMYQFQQLLSIHLPELAAHLHNLNIQPTYAAQWFLSFFAVTCPLPMLLRIYDVIFAEGVPETLMRVALSLMRRNEKRLLFASEFEEVQQMLLARGLWDPFKCNANELVEDFVSLTGVVTRETLADLQKRFEEDHSAGEVKVAPASPKTSEEKVIQQSAMSFLGRLWGGATQAASVTLSPPANSKPSRPTSIIRRTPSKQSLSTICSYDSAMEPSSGTASSATTMSRCSSIVTEEPRHSTRSVRKNKDGDLHGQIEDLLLALSALQKENAQKDEELHSLREARENDRKLTRRLVALLGGEGEEDSVVEISDLCDQITEAFAKEDPLPATSSAQLTKQLNEDLQCAREEVALATAREKDMQQRLAEQAEDVARLRQQVNEIKARWQDGQKEKLRLEKQLSELRNRKNSMPFDPPDSPISAEWEPQGPGGLREFKLGRTSSGPSTRSQPTFNKRSSSLGIQSVLSNTDNQAPPSTDVLLLELVASKTAEAVAKQEAEEAKAKLDALRRAMNNLSNSASVSSSPSTSPGLEKTLGNLAGYLGGNSTPAVQTTNTSQSAAPAAYSGPFGRWGWGTKRAS